MARVYSTLFYSGEPPFGSSTEVAGPPVGSVWVVRDVVAWNSNQEYGALVGWVIEDSEGAPIAASVQDRCRYYQVSRWEGRQVLEGDADMFIIPQDIGWHMRISGYLLTP